MRKISKDKWKKWLLAYRKSKLRKRILLHKKECSREFKNDLLDLFEMCYENHTDTCTVTFEYPNGVMEIDFTFRAKKRVEDGNDKTTVND